MLRLTTFATEKNRRYVAVVVNNSREDKTIRFHLSNPSWKTNYAGGLVTDLTRTLEAHPLAAVPGQERCYETVVPLLSLTTFVWAEKDSGSLTLPEGTPKR